MSGVVDSWFESIGTFAYGGYYIGDINVDIGGSGEMSEGTYAIIMAPRTMESGKLVYQSPAVSIGVNSLIDGLANTRKTRETGNSPAINWLDNLGKLGSGQVSDAYIPAANELDLAWVNRSKNGLSSLLDMRPDWYWTSTETSPGIARRQNFSNGAKDTSGKSNYQQYVRPCWRIKIA